MAEEIRKPNPWLRWGVLIMLLGVFLWNYFQERKPLIQAGKLEYRMVAGTRDSSFQVILLETADRYVILDSAYREILTTEDGELMSRAKQLRLLEQYQNIEYRVGFNEETSGLKPGYRVTRELFNSFRFGESVRYEVNKKQRDALLQLIL
jgi:hypothetical protein